MLSDGLNRWHRQGTHHDDIDLGDAVFDHDLDIDHLGGGATLRHVVLNDDRHLFGRVGGREHVPATELHWKHHDDGGNGCPPNPPQNRRVTLQRIAAGNKTGGEENDRGGDHDANHVGEEEEHGPNGQLPFRQLKCDADDRQRWQQRHGNRNARQGFRGVPSDLSICARCACGKRDPEIEQVRRCTRQQLGRERIRVAGDDKRDHRRQNNGEHRSDRHQQHPADDAKRPPHNDRRCGAQDREHEGGDEHGPDHHRRRVGQDPEHGDRRRQHHQRSEPSEELAARHSLREQSTDDLTPLDVVQRFAPLPEALDTKPCARDQPSRTGSWLEPWRIAWPIVNKCDRSPLGLAAHLRKHPDRDPHLSPLAHLIKVTHHESFGDKNALTKRESIDNLHKGTSYRSVTGRLDRSGAAVFPALATAWQAARAPAPQMAFRQRPDLPAEPPRTSYRSISTGWRPAFENAASDPPLLGGERP